MTTLLFDLDGIFVRRYAKRPQMANQNALAKILEILALHKPRVIFLSDRPAGQLPYFVWILHGDRYHAGELGSAIFDRDTYRVFVAQEYKSFANRIRPQIVQALSAKFFLDASFADPNQEPGGKQVTISIEPPLHLPEEFTKQRVAEALSEFRDQITVSGGSAISIYPADLTKLQGLQILERLYLHVGREIVLSDTVWLADNDRDIPIVQYLAEHGGSSAAVGNATEKFKDEVKKNGGLIFPGEYEEGVLQILQALFP